MKPESSRACARLQEAQRTYYALAEDKAYNYIRRSLISKVSPPPGHQPVLSMGVTNWRHNDCLSPCRLLQSGVGPSLLSQSAGRVMRPPGGFLVQGGHCNEADTCPPVRGPFWGWQHPGKTLGSVPLVWDGRQGKKNCPTLWTVSTNLHPKATTNPLGPPAHHQHSLWAGGQVCPGSWSSWTMPHSKMLDGLWRHYLAELWAWCHHPSESSPGCWTNFGHRGLCHLVPLGHPSLKGHIESYRLSPAFWPCLDPQGDPLGSGDPIYVMPDG